MLLRSLFRPRAFGAFLGLALCLWAPSPAVAQTGCRFGPGSGDAVSQQFPNGVRMSWLGHPHFLCGGGVEIWADSAEIFSSQNMSHLIGRVRYLDQGREMRADDARYFSALGRLQAYGHLFVRDTVRGSVIENGDLEYLRQSSTRAVERMRVTTGPDGVRPKARLYMRAAEDTTATTPGGAVPDSAATLPDTTRGVLPDTTLAPAPPDTTHAAAPDTTHAAAPPDTTHRAPPDSARGAVASPPRAPVDTTQAPYIVEADRLDLQGDTYFRADGTVKIVRDSLNAFADTAEYDQVAGRMLLQGSARVQGSGYDLAGRTVNIAVPGGEISEVRAVHEAVLTGDQLHMTAPVITIFMNDGARDRLGAIPLRPAGRAPVADSADLARPVALAEQFRLTADSVDARAPAQILDTIFAVGTARGESSAGDSLNVPSLPEVARKDWIEGDTLVVTFVKVEPQTDQPADTAHYALDRLVARGDARSLYRILPSDSTARPGIDPPAVHYVLGTQITIILASGAVDHMEVEGPRGWHLEPLARGARDSLAVRDTSRAADTTAARPDTSVAHKAGAEPARKDRSRRTGGGARETAGHPATGWRERGRGRNRRRRQR